MANCHRGRNVSKSMTSLNAVPSVQDLANHNQDNLDLDKELAMFTNTQFFDFDLGQDTDPQPLSFDFNAQPRVAPALATENTKDMEFIADDYAFLCFASFLQADGLPTVPISPQTQTSHPMYPVSNLSSPHSGLDSPWAVEKLPADAIEGTNDVPTFENASRLAVEVDKRRRNTAASTRFRVKKKQREQTLEKFVKEMANKVNTLEGRITQLETENRWLKSLITERNERKDDTAALWKKYNQEMSERKASERKDGVGSGKP